MDSSPGYVHGYSEREAVRLSDQARTLSALLHHDTFYPPGSKVLEAGCGVGSQTVVLARNNPQVSFVSVDICPESLRQAKAHMEQEGIRNVEFQQADLFHLPYPRDSFDHVFLCFVLEHVHNPVSALFQLMRVLRTGGSLTAIEGDHGSTYFYPDNQYSKEAIRCLVDLQARAGGDALIGTTAVSAVCPGGFEESQSRPANGLCGCLQAGAGGRFYKEYVCRHGGGRGRAGIDIKDDDERRLAAGDCGFVSSGRRRRDV